VVTPPFFLKDTHEVRLIIVEIDCANKISGDVKAKAQVQCKPNSKKSKNLSFECQVLAVSIFTGNVVLSRKPKLARVMFETHKGRDFFSQNWANP